MSHEGMSRFDIEVYNFALEILNMIEADSIFSAADRSAMMRRINAELRVVIPNETKEDTKKRIFEKLRAKDFNF